MNTFSDEMWVERNRVRERVINDMVGQIKEVIRKNPFVMVINITMTSPRYPRGLLICVGIFLDLVKDKLTKMGVYLEKPKVIMHDRYEFDANYTATFKSEYTLAEPSWKEKEETISQP
jgi:hypothetical protein